MLKLKTPVIRMDYLIKSDRINVLRKQYDAFLEEDKKRKDRNDYILGRLDNMRYSSTAVQVRVRHTPNTCNDYFAPTYSRYANRPENVEHNMQLVHMNQQMSRPSYHNLQLDVPRNVIEENSILKEISKKYILIPKLRSTLPTDVPEVISSSTTTPVPSVMASDVDNSDWKSKYDILEQLKKKEKDETNKYAYNDKNNLNRTNDQGMQNITREDLPSRYEEEIPEKDVSDQLLVENELKSLEKFTINAKTDEIPSTDVNGTSSPLYLNSENAAPFYPINSNDTIEQNAPQAAHTSEYYTQPEQYEEHVITAENIVEATSQIDNNQYQENSPEQELHTQQEYPIEYEQFMPNTEADTNHTEPEKVINEEEYDYSPIEVLNPNESVDELNKDSVQEPNETENEYRTEITNAQEYTPEVATAILQEGNMNPENYMTDDGTIVQGNPVPQMLTEDPTDNSGIEEFDAEQKEMFYSEQADQNYAYDDQGAAGGAYNAGDAYNAEYAQNQNYPQAQEYAYYEGAEQQEGAYPVEINEHEETQQLYDQHYEQQYDTNYEKEYEQQPVYMGQDPNQPQFEQPALYDQAQQELEHYTNDQQPAETQEQVEQVLDHEDGYIEKRVENPATQEEDKQTAELTVS